MIKFWTDERVEWLRVNVPGHHYSEIAAKWAEDFPDVPADITKIKRGMGKYKIRTGFDGRYYEGHPGTSGRIRKGVRISPDTEFKKGQRPHNAKPVGTILWDCVGYYKIKIAEPNKWQWLQRKIWEDAHGPIPKGNLIIFKDGNVKNCKLENLMMITRAENIMMTHFDLRSSDPEATEIGLNVARLRMAINKRKKERKKKNDRGHKKSNECRDRTGGEIR